MYKLVFLPEPVTEERVYSLFEFLQREVLIDGGMLSKFVMTYQIQPNFKLAIPFETLNHAKEIAAKAAGEGFESSALDCSTGETEALQTWLYGKDWIIRQRLSKLGVDVPLSVKLHRPERTEEMVQSFPWNPTF